ncbi:alpha/beta fold hydrolase [Gallaecimonas mangrovi]|uniref:alpha/beta fold hydrolase n=1 Tax=Gallaecimonas mangrovi TaxID=2291597 RepID=UPI000E2030FC|nr:alpha/beta hydrolase [Gallaecimonas mangrovi]
MSTPVVFFPGTQCDERIFLPLWRLLDIEDRRYVPLQWAETLEQMLALADYAAEGEQVHLVGFSMGGYIASRFALDNPQLVASLTLIGFDAAGLSETEEKQRAQIIKSLDRGQFKPMSEARLSMMVSDDSPNSQDAKAVVREMEADLGGSVVKYHMMAASKRPDLRPALNKARFPIQIVAANNDKMASLSALNAMHHAIASSELAVVEPSGHMMPLEQPEQLAAILTPLLS